MHTQKKEEEKTVFTCQTTARFGAVFAGAIQLSGNPDYYVIESDVWRHKWYFYMIVIITVLFRWNALSLTHLKPTSHQHFLLQSTHSLGDNRKIQGQGHRKHRIKFIAFASLHLRCAGNENFTTKSTINFTICFDWQLQANTHFIRSTGARPSNIPFTWFFQ